MVNRAAVTSVPLLLRLIVLPAAALMVCGPILVGYASSRHPHRVERTSRAARQQAMRQAAQQSDAARGRDVKASQTQGVQVGRLDPHASVRQNKGDDTDGKAANSGIDPVEDYKTALSLLQKNYYGDAIDKKKQQQLTYEAIRGMVGGLKDQFSSFLDPDEWTQMQATTEGDFEGIGAVLGKDGPFVRIVEPIETGPAEQAGLQTDDLIIRVENVSVEGQELSEVVRRLKGKRGTKVHITVRRGRQNIVLNIARARVEPPVVKYWMEDPKAKIGHILLKEFNKRSVEQMNRAFTNLQAQGMRALVFDMRYNPGGLLDSAIDVASVFIPQDARPELHNVVMYMRESTGGEQKRLLGGVDSTYTHHVPLVVLVNDNSASASEIVAGAIKDYGAATLMGERTYGKGRVQTLIPLQDNSALRLTTQLYLPPRRRDLSFKRDEDGNRIAGTGGIPPDIEVKQSPKWKPEDWKDKADDTQLHAALDFLRARLNGQTIAQATQRVQQAH